MKVQNIINHNGNASRNQFVITHNGATYFQSYDSVIAKYEDGKLTITPLWDCSNTTRKHFYIFVSDYCYGYWGTREDILNGIKEGRIKVVKDGELDI